MDGCPNLPDMADLSLAFRKWYVGVIVTSAGLVLGLSACGNSSGGTPEAASSTRLSPAPSQPVTAECSVALTTSADGNVSPLLCPSGGVNIRAWRVYATNNLLVMEQPRDATEYQVVQAFCSDLANGHTTLTVEQSAEELAAQYNGWSFGGDSAATDPNCSE